MSKTVPNSELVGLHEVSELLGLSKPAVRYRASEHMDFPEPLARLRSGPVWARDDIVSYARECDRVFHEQPGVKHLARYGTPNREPARVTKQRLDDAQWAEQLEAIIRRGSS